jgi:predicted negative regulator of RcsB-dependent stress response
MAYDLEEQEQLAQLKGWWKDHGTKVLMAVIVLAASASAWRGWEWYQRNQSAQASALYEQLAKGAAAGDAKAVRDAAGSLFESHPGSMYASMAALTAARFNFDRNDLKAAKLQLQWAVDKARTDELRDLARLRLAGLLMDEKAYDEALKLLEAKHADAFVAQYAVMRGDLLVAKNQAAEAKAAYKLALEKADKKQGGAFKESVQVRLDALGG